VPNLPICTGRTREATYDLSEAMDDSLSAGEPSEPDPTSPSPPSPCLDVLPYIHYEDLSSCQLPATAEWSGRKAALEYSVKSVINETNITIHGWIASTRHGEQLTSDYKLAGS
jgi:hypothetical protein